MGGSGGKGGKGGTPESPDFVGIAEAQGGINQDLLDQQTFANRPDQYGPFGSTTWEYTPGAPTPEAAGGAGAQPGSPLDYVRATIGGAGIDPSAIRGGGQPDTEPGRWTQRSSLAEPLQTAADALMAQLAGGASLDPSQTRDQAIDSAYRMQTSRLDPRLAAQRSARETQLANEGYTRGDEGWVKEFGGTAGDTNYAGAFNQAENDAYQQALFGAQSGAGQTAFAQALAANMQPYTQLGAIRSLSSPNGFTPASMGGGTDLLGAAQQQYGADLNGYNAGQASKNSKMGGAAALAPLAVSASDERLKTEIERLDTEAIPGVPFARWKWKDTGEVGFGVIAQDLEKVRPDLVVEIGGIKHVRYGGIR
jgi:hypothetical protein